MGKTGLYRKGGHKRLEERGLAGNACLEKETNYLSKRTKKEDFGWYLSVYTAFRFPYVLRITPHNIYYVV